MFYFAWVDAADTEWASEFARNDEQVFAFQLTHEEGDFPALEITLRNPRVGLLAEGRPLWAWFACDHDGDVKPLFFGRLVAMPDDLQEELITLEFQARPSDFAAQKEAIAATLRVRPYWDGIWFGPETRYDPDNVLESRPELWHIDRVTHEVTTSNIVSGEDGSVSYGTDVMIYESMHMTYAQTPLRRVEVIASVSWNQNAADGAGLDFSPLCNFGGGSSIVTYTGKGLQDNWPKTGQTMQGGWFVADGHADRIDGNGQAIWGYGLRNNVGASAGTSANPFGRSYNASEEFHDVIVPEWAVASHVIFTDFPAHTFGVPRWRLVPTLRLGYNVSRKREEGIAFVLEADVQAIVTDPGEDDVLQLAFTSSEVAAPVDPVEDSESSAATEVEGQLFNLPIGDVRNRVYFASARGSQSIEYLIALARSRLLARARCVNVEVEVPFTEGVAAELSCRKNMVVTDERLPGGIAAGKITGYSLSLDGDTGDSTCQIVMGCTVGKGNAVSPVTGTPVYVDAGYVEPGYQRYEGAFVMPISGEVTYLSIEGTDPEDDGVDFTNMRAEDFVVEFVKTGSFQEQEVAMGDFADEPNTVFDRLNAVSTEFRLVLKPLTGGPFAVNYAIPTSMLMVAKTIDLEAESLT